MDAKRLQESQKLTERVIETKSCISRSCDKNAVIYCMPGVRRGASRAKTLQSTGSLGKSYKELHIAVIGDLN